ncbi:AMMECR1 domain-containing protein [Synechococcus sp. R55.8]|uniref:AMMECR1 domain-containing protein n=1 Tax=Synechococcus sp. R55.8 TaxID=2964501 RepID=UPI0039C1DD0E
MSTCRVHFTVRLLGLQGLRPANAIGLLLAAGLGLWTGSLPQPSETTAPVPPPESMGASHRLRDRTGGTESDSEGIPSPSRRQPLPDTLPALARQAIAYYFATGQVLPPPEEIPPHWRRSAGVFVTVSTEGRPRGCWGSLDPSGEDLARATIRAAVGAVTRDWRYVPLQPGELESASIQVAIVRRVVPIASAGRSPFAAVEQVDPTRMGLFVRSGTRGAVLLPGEALTTEWQLATAKRLAGIPADQPVELFRVEAELLHEF